MHAGLDDALYIQVCACMHAYMHALPSFAGNAGQKKKSQVTFDAVRIRASSGQAVRVVDTYLSR